MRWIILVAWFLAMLAPAKADSITITLTTPAGLCAAGCAKTFTDAPTNTIQTNIVTVFQSSCNSSISGTCTVAQVLTFWATSLKNTFVQQVTTYQTQQLQNAAAAGYVPINPQ
jgi:hypothetical protein